MSTAQAKKPLPTSDKGWQAFLQNQKHTGEREKPWALGQALFARLEPSGRILLYTRMRRRGDRNPRPFNLGDFPAVSVAEARKRLADTRSQIKEGKDPAIEKRRQRAGISNVGTFAELVDNYLARRRASGDLAPKTLLLESQALETLKGALGGRLLSDIEGHDVFAPIEAEARRLQKKGRTGRMAKIMLAATKRAFLDARDAGILRGPSPVADLSLKRVVAEKPRDRVLFDGVLLVDRLHPDRNEVGLLLANIRAVDDAIGGDAATRAAIELALALGLRAHEVCGLEWSHLRLDGPMPALFIAKSKTAAGERTLPLPAGSVALLREIKADANPRAKFVFEGRAKERKTGHSRDHLHPESLSRGFSRACDALGIQGATLHDLRRTCASGLVQLGADEGLVQRIIGHAAQSTLGRHYDRAPRLEPMQAALSTWASALDDAAARYAKKALPGRQLALPAPVDGGGHDTK